MDDEGLPIILEQPDDEPSTNWQGALLGVALAPIALVLGVIYVKVVWCVLVHVWYWVNF